MGHPEAGPDRVRQLPCRDIQWRQQAQTLHSHRNDRLPGAGAACESASDDELNLCLGFWVLCGDLSMKWLMDPDGKPYVFSQAWPEMAHTLAGDHAARLTLA